ncbi:MAG TPA: hypothetical protein VEC13_01895 [Candidatus Paceibacterota bacterium]|nr:hypothetical protein [Candidatus Paceibacterota bacterium]
MEEFEKVVERLSKQPEFDLFHQERTGPIAEITNEEREADLAELRNLIAEHEEAFERLKERGVTKSVREKMFTEHNVTSVETEEGKRIDVKSAEGQLLYSYSSVPSPFNPEDEEQFEDVRLERVKEFLQEILDADIPINIHRNFVLDTGDTKIPFDLYQQGLPIVAAERKLDKPMMQAAGRHMGSAGGGKSVLGTKIPLHTFLGISVLTHELGHLVTKSWYTRKTEWLDNPYKSAVSAYKQDKTGEYFTIYPAVYRAFLENERLANLFSKMTMQHMLLKAGWTEDEINAHYLIRYNVYIKEVKRRMQEQNLI